MCGNVEIIHNVKEKITRATTFVNKRVKQKTNKKKTTPEQNA